MAVQTGAQREERVGREGEAAQRLQRLQREGAELHLARAAGPHHQPGNAVEERGLGDGHVQGGGLGSEVGVREWVLTFLLRLKMTSTSEADQETTVSPRTTAPSRPAAE